MNTFIEALTEFCNAFDIPVAINDILLKIVGILGPVALAWQCIIKVPVLGEFLKSREKKLIELFDLLVAKIFKGLKNKLLKGRNKNGKKTKNVKNNNKTNAVQKKNSVRYNRKNKKKKKKNKKSKR